MERGVNYITIITVFALGGLLDFPGNCYTRYFLNSWKPQLSIGVWEQGINYITIITVFDLGGLLDFPGTWYYLNSLQPQLYTGVW